MPTIPIPKSTGLSHAVRWIVLRQRFLGYQDAEALGDHPKVDEPHFQPAKRELLLALRHGLIRSTGNLEVFDGRYTVHKEPFFLSDQYWDEYLDEFARRVAHSKKGQIFVGHGIPVPSSLWTEQYVRWESNCLHYDKGVLQARFLTTYLDTSDLLKQFSGADIQTIRSAVMPDSLSESERRSVLKLIAAMAIRGYKFDPTARRNQATADIESDLSHLGLQLDQKTILKWVREAVALVDEASDPRD